MLTDRQKLNRAFARIRAAGGVTVTGQCCQSCSWAAAEAKGAKDSDTVAIHHQQGIEHAFSRGAKHWGDTLPGMLVADLAIYHQGNTALICEALKAEGLNVGWSGDPDKAIIVRKPEEEAYS